MARDHDGNTINNRYIPADSILFLCIGGTDIIPMPDHLRTLPMPLWNVALEIHSGRIYSGTPATYFFVFLIGLPVFRCLLSGYRITRR